MQFHFLRTGKAPERSREVRKMMRAVLGAVEKWILRGTYSKVWFLVVSERVKNRSLKCSRKAHATAQTKRFSDFLTNTRCDKEQKLNNTMRCDWPYEYRHLKFTGPFLMVKRALIRCTFGPDGRMKIVLFEKHDFFDDEKKIGSRASKRPFRVDPLKLFFSTESKHEDGQKSLSSSQRTYAQSDFREKWYAHRRGVEKTRNELPTLHEKQQKKRAPRRVRMRFLISSRPPERERKFRWSSWLMLRAPVCPLLLWTKM